MWDSLRESQTIIRVWARKIEPLYVSEAWRIYKIEWECQSLEEVESEGHTSHHHATIILV